MIKCNAPGERAERCQWQIQQGERVAAVEKIEGKRKPEDFFGHRNRKVGIPFASWSNLYLSFALSKGKMQTSLGASLA